MFIFFNILGDCIKKSTIHDHGFFACKNLMTEKFENFFKNFIKVFLFYKFFN